MTAAWALAFALLCAALLVLPFAPAWREWRRPTDAGALEVPEDGGQDPLFLAKRFREQMARLRPAGPGIGYQPVDEVDLLDTEDEAAQGGRPILAVQTVRSAGAVASLRPLYSTADLELRGGAMFKQVMSEGRMDLGPRSRITGWAHADKAVRLGANSVVAQRVSSGETLFLERGCCFERVHAPMVCFGRPQMPARRHEGERARGDLAALPKASRRADGLWRVDGDCNLPDGVHFVGSLIVTGVLTLGAGTRVEGNIKSHKGILIGPGAEVDGSVICDNGIHVLSGAWIGGPVVSETHLLLSAGARIGRPDAMTTVNAGAIIAQEGVVAHGTVWARQAGVVWGAQA